MTARDKVTAIGGTAITYDAIGNPLSYDGWTFTWKAGRMLDSLVKTGTNAQFSYDHNGLRIKKVVNGVTTHYTLSGRNIVHMTQGSSDLHFFYDAQGRPAMVRFGGTDYFYVYDLQGDVVAMVDTDGTQVVEYMYDAWGAPISKTGSLASTLGSLNPFRYRGYVYDEETGLYYLRTRYYNPLWKRFISSDIWTGKIGSLVTHNLFAYTLGNPVKYYDPTGAGAITASPAKVAEAQELLSKVGYQLPDGEINYIEIGPEKYDEYGYSFINITIIANMEEEDDIRSSEFYDYYIIKKHMGLSELLNQYIVSNSAYSNINDAASSVDPSGLSVLFVGGGIVNKIMNGILGAWSNLTFAASVFTEICAQYVGLDE